MQIYSRSLAIWPRCKQCKGESITKRKYVQSTEKKTNKCMRKRDDENIQKKMLEPIVLVEKCDRYLGLCKGMTKGNEMLFKEIQIDKHQNFSGSNGNCRYSETMPQTLFLKIENEDDGYDFSEYIDEKIESESSHHITNLDVKEEGNEMLFKEIQNDKHQNFSGSNGNCRYSGTMPQTLFLKIENEDDGYDFREYIDENIESESSHHITNLDVKKEVGEETYDIKEHSISTVQAIAAHNENNYKGSNFLEEVVHEEGQYPVNSSSTSTEKFLTPKEASFLHYVSTYQKHLSHEFKVKIANELQVPDKLVLDWFEYRRNKDYNASVRNSGKSLLISEENEIEVFNVEQETVLQSIYMCNRQPSQEFLEKLAQHLELPCFVLQVWFLAVRRNLIKFEYKSDFKVTAPDFEETYLKYMKPQFSLQNNKCNICKNKISTELGLSRHFNKVHEISFYQCNICENSYVLKEDFLIHLGDTHGILPHICRACGEYIFRPPLFQGHYYLCSKRKPQI